MGLQQSPRFGGSPLLLKEWFPIPCDVQVDQDVEIGFRGADGTFGADFDGAIFALHRQFVQPHNAGQCGIARGC